MGYCMLHGIRLNCVMWWTLLQLYWLCDSKPKCSADGLEGIHYVVVFEVMYDSLMVEVARDRLLGWF